jgi:hypothetical protein
MPWLPSSTGSPMGAPSKSVPSVVKECWASTFFWQRLLLAYARTFLAVISQSVACSQHHTIPQRLARWLLTINDYSGGREIQMVQKSIAEMLGVRRVGITEAASELQSAKLISYRRGRIKILDKVRLGKSSCECYRFIRQEYIRLHAPERQSAYRKRLG